VTQLPASLLEETLVRRAPLLEGEHDTACRLFNGFLEGCPELAVDLYGSTVVIYNHAREPEQGQPLVETTRAVLQQRLPWLQAGIVNFHNSPMAEERRGRLLFGEAPDWKVQEQGTWYALDLCRSRDAGLYLDTRKLRTWLREHMAGMSVLNTFAYTGSLGMAALAGGAERVVQLDVSRSSLQVARRSYALNGFPVNEGDLIAGDFWVETSRMRRAGERFDCVLLDPPFFATGARTSLDLEKDSTRLINKVRPLVRDGGWLVSVNNALYMSGQEYLQALEGLCMDGFVDIEELIPVPEDFTGYPETRVGEPISDPAPFNHSTKIAVLKVRRKDG
jgi:23S rRNA (cytosine1962-C5)-methyltransferase